MRISSYAISTYLCVIMRLAATLALPAMPSHQAPPLYVWLIALTLVGVALLLAYLLLDDPLRYLARERLPQRC
jgi:hypothetical protein